MTDSLKNSAIEYHELDPPGKLQIAPTKPLATQRDLALAYSPGVAAACEAIVDEPGAVSRMTVRGNLVAVISNGTAVLGLGDIGPLAAKPVMEGKAVLFKKFSGIDVFDLEVDETDPDRFVEAIAALEPTFGGINLEDIKAPECFEIEARLRARMDIPVFHDDQHGTAIVTSAAVLNGLQYFGKDIAEVRLVACGAGAAAIACLDLLTKLGLPKRNILVCDKTGVIFEGRTEDMDPYKGAYANETACRTLTDALVGADIFLGLSAGNVVTAEMVAAMADRPLILALANPEPEIRPELVKSVRSDAIIATGRSDYPNQVNNVLCFPFIFRGALDVGAKTINEEMKRACAEAIARIAQTEVSDVVLSAYGADRLVFGPDYIIPKPFDPRLITEVSAAVARAAMDSGVATRPIEDFDKYRDRLTRFRFRSGTLMQPVFETAAADPKRVVYAEGEGERVLQAVHQALEAGIAKPILIGRPERIAERIGDLGLRLDLENAVEVVDPGSESVSEAYTADYLRLTGRDGASPPEAERIVRTDATVLAFLMLARGDADAAICGTGGGFERHLERLRTIIGKAEGVRDLSTLNALVLPAGTFFVADTFVTPDPTAEELVGLTLLSVDAMRRFGIEPRVALLSHSNFGSRDTPAAAKMRRAYELLRERDPDFEVEGEMQGDAALSETIRNRVNPDTRLSGQANLWVMPNIDAAHIAFNLLKLLGGGVSVGPIMLGAAKPAHIVSHSITVRGLLNISAVAVVDAQARK